MSDDVQVPIMTLVEKYRTTYEELHHRFICQTVLAETLQTLLDEKVAELEKVNTSKDKGK